MKVKIMKIILNISPYFVLAFFHVVMKRFVSVTAYLIHNNYQSESMVGDVADICPKLSRPKIYRKPNPRSLVKGFIKMTENNYVIKEDPQQARDIEPMLS